MPVCDKCHAEIDPTRTELQNRALHLWFRLVADALEEGGIEMKTVLQRRIDTPWTPTAVKELLWRPVMKEYLLENSTTRMSTKHVPKIYEILNRFFAENWGLHVPFPSNNFPRDTV